MQACSKSRSLLREHMRVLGAARAPLSPALRRPAPTAAPAVTPRSPLQLLAESLCSPRFESHTCMPVLTARGEQLDLSTWLGGGAAVPLRHQCRRGCTPPTWQRQMARPLVARLSPLPVAACGTVHPSPACAERCLFGRPPRPAPRLHSPFVPPRCASVARPLTPPICHSLLRLHNAQNTQKAKQGLSNDNRIGRDARR